MCQSDACLLNYKQKYAMTCLTPPDPFGPPYPITGTLSQVPLYELNSFSPFDKYSEKLSREILNLQRLRTSILTLQETEFLTAEIV